MGKLFRDSGYCKHVTVGKRTVKAGECALVFSLGGKCQVIPGPRRVRVWFSTVRFLDTAVAAPDQYLRVQHRDTGAVEHIPGPATLCINPVVHLSVNVKNSTSLAAGEAVVVYKHEGIRAPALGEPALAADAAPAKKAAAAALPARASGASRRLVQGPAMLVPAPDETLHEFAWAKGPVISLRRLRLTAKASVPAPNSGLKAAPAAELAEVAIEAVYSFDARRVLEDLLDGTSEPLEDMRRAAKEDARAAFRGGAAEGAHATAERLSKSAPASAFPALLAAARAAGAEVHKVTVTVESGGGPAEAEAVAVAAREAERRAARAEEAAAEAERAVQREMRAAEAREELARRTARFEAEARAEAHAAELALERDRDALERERLKALVDELGADFAERFVLAKLHYDTAREAAPKAEEAPGKQKGPEEQRAPTAVPHAPAPPPPRALVRPAPVP